MPGQIYNILILGETGVGKSTFLNTLLNYFTYEKLADVTKLRYFVGTKFIMMNENFTERTIALEEDDNEQNLRGKSATKSAKMHQIVLPDGDILNLIDTPGIGDTEGMETDYKNVERTLAFISELEYLNAICILFKPNNSRLGIVFDYCIKTILGQLDKPMRKNVVFVFTNGRSSFYTPGDTHQPLQKILDEMDPERIDPVPFNRTNTFCVENDWFRYLAAKQNGVQFTAKEVKNFEESWKKSSDTSKRMVNYIKTLPPRKLKGMVTVNEAKRLIRRLIKPISNILASHRKERRQLKLKTSTINSLKSNKKILEEHLITDGTTTATQTTQINTQETKTTIRIGTGVGIIPPFLNAELDTNRSSDIYERKQEDTVLLHQKVEDPNVRDQITRNEQATQTQQAESQEIENMIKEYETEFQTLLSAAAQFHVFLKENVPFYSRDETEAYLQQKIKEYEGATGFDDNDLKMYKVILKRYKMKLGSTHSVTMQEVQDVVQSLIKLKHCGSQLRRELGIEGESTSAQ